MTPEQTERIRAAYRRWHGTLAPCGISHADIFNPCLPEDDGGRLLCLTCWTHQRLELTAGRPHSPYCELDEDGRGCVVSCPTAYTVDLRDLERRENRPCPGCRHLPRVHYAGRPASILYCDDCPGGICYTWTPDGREVGPGEL